MLKFLSFEKAIDNAATMERHMFAAVKNDGAFYESMLKSSYGSEEALGGWLHETDAACALDDMMDNCYSE